MSKKIWVRIYFETGIIIEKEFPNGDALREYLEENKLWKKWRIIRDPND
jgi:hypothetical protein